MSLCLSYLICYDSLRRQHFHGFPEAILGQEVRLYSGVVHELIAIAMNSNERVWSPEIWTPRTMSSIRTEHAFCSEPVSNKYQIQI